MITASVEQNYRDWLREIHGPAHGRRTAEKNAAFFLPHLQPGFRVLDAGCGGGSITVGLGSAVAPGEVIGVDISEHAIREARDRAAATGVANATFEVVDANNISYEAARFDAAFAHALLQHVESPIAVLRELRRVIKPGGIVGVADMDFDGSAFAPGSKALWRSLQVIRRTRQNPNVGRDLRSLLGEAGFVDVEASAKPRGPGTAAQVKLEGEFWCRYFAAEPFVSWVESQSWATRQEMGEMSSAWRAWGDDPGASSSHLWCEAVGKVPSP